MAKAAPAPAVEEAEVDFQAYKEKGATDLQERFAEWIIDKLSMTFGSKKEQAAFEEGVRLATALRMVFQASPENQAVLAERRASAGDREREAAKSVRPAKKAAAAAPTEPPPAQRRPAKKATTRKAAAEPAAAADAEEAAVVSEPQTRPAQRRPARRRPATAASTEAEAPF